MTIGQRKEFSFHTCWIPGEGLQLRQIGNLRPPNELIQKAREIADEKLTDEHTEMSDSDPVYIGIVEVGFLYFAGESEKNELVDEYEFDDRNRVETGVLSGDKVAGEYHKRSHDGGLVYDDNPSNMYEPYQDKGWLTVDGEYYAPSDDKPDGWTI